jgi:hypothetical protein
MMNEAWKCGACLLVGLGTLAHVSLAQVAIDRPALVKNILRLTRITPLGPGKVRIEWRSVPNQEYAVIRSTSPAPDPRTETLIEGRIPATPPLNSLVDATAQSRAPFSTGSGSRNDDRT